MEIVKTAALSICVPTYNRVGALRALHDSFLSRALNTYGDEIQVIVCDNSDASIAEQNKNMLHPSAKYFWNEKNIKFAGNFLRCIKEAEGTFIWIISDDDIIIWSGFVALLNNVIENRNGDLDCLMVPFITKTPYGDAVYANRDVDWGVRSETTAIVLTQSKECPFILFSSGVLRLNKSSVAAIEGQHSRNAYIQTLAFLNMLRKESRVRFLCDAVIEYQPGYIGQTIGVAEMAESLYEVRKYIEDKFDVQPDYDSDYRGWLLWLLHHRGGFYYLFCAESDRWILLRKLHNHKSIKAFLLAIAIMIPKLIIRPIYLVYKSVTDARVYRPLTLKAVVSRIKVNWRFMNDVRRRHPK